MRGWGVDEGFLEASGGMSCQLTTGRKPDGSQRSSVSAVRDCGRFPIKLHKS